MDSLLVYGAYGSTGRAVAREVVSRGGTPVVAGRNRRAVARQAAALGVEGRSFDLESPDLAGHLDGIDAVVNCAGPFAETAEPLVEACLAAGVDYLDVTGEFAVVERLRRRDADAREAGIAVLPAVGFEVVPSDCLAAELAARVPTADELAVAVRAPPSISRGTARTLLDSLGEGVVRRNGRLVRVPAAYRSRKVDFGDGPERAVTVPLADVVTAAHSLGVGTVETYLALPAAAESALRLADVAAPCIRCRPVRRLLERGIEALVDGLDFGRAGAEADGAVVWAAVRDGDTGRTASAGLRTPNPYALTAETAVTAAERILAGETRVRTGFQTPATAFGPSFVTQFDGVERGPCERPAVADRTGGSSVDVDG